MTATLADPKRAAFERWARPRGVCLDRVRGSDVYLDRAQELWTALRLGVELSEQKKVRTA